MQVTQHTVKHSAQQAGRYGAGGVCPSAQKCLASTDVNIVVGCLFIANEQFKPYASDLDMM